MIKEIYIFRHGQTDKNLAQIWQGSGADDLLNETGIKQAEDLAERVKDLGLTVLYSSPLLRAFMTANAIAHKSPIPLPIISLQELKECNFGDAEGLTFDQVRETYPDLIDKIVSPTFDNWDVKFPNGESKHHAFLRFERILNNLLQSPDSTIGIMIHAGLLSAICCGLGIRDADFSNCSVLHLRYDTALKVFTYP